jgi:RNA methyltransferase, TrmH family
MATSPNLADSLRAAQASGMQVIATEVSATVPYWDVDLRPPTLILLGNEGAGLSAELAAIADHRVQIPLAPGVESLNVAISAAVILYEARRQRG